MSKLDMATIDRITLEKIQFNMQQMVSSTLLSGMKFESMEDIITQSFIQRLTFYLLGNKVHDEDVETTVRTYPATMWEELKRDFWPKWLKRRFPIRYSRDVTQHNYKHYHVCPHLNYKDDRKHLEFMMWNDTKPTAEDLETHRDKLERVLTHLG